MNAISKLRVPTVGFSFKPVVFKPKKVASSYKPLSKTLYCLALKTEEGWKAFVNTRGLPDHEDVTILEFTDKSFDLKGRMEVFYHTKDKTGHYTRIIRTEVEANSFPGNPETYCTLCDKCVFSGHIVKVNGVYKFDMSLYKGTRKQCEELLTKSNKKNKDEEE